MGLEDYENPLWYISGASYPLWLLNMGEKYFKPQMATNRKNSKAHDHK